jgi:hypothetical protein
MFYAACFFAGGARFGEAAARRWRDYDPELQPLGRLKIETSYSTKTKKEKNVKTEVARHVPVHPVYAALLAEWKLSGWEQLMGRAPSADDLIVPSREGAFRNANHMLHRFHEDLERVGLRPRRLHDLRRTFISLCREDGANKELLRWVTHGVSADVMDTYTTPTWEALCSQVAVLKLDLRRGEVIALPKAAAGGGGEAGGGGGTDDPTGYDDEQVMPAASVPAASCQVGDGAAAHTPKKLSTWACTRRRPGCSASSEPERTRDFNSGPGAPPAWLAIRRRGPSR